MFAGAISAGRLQESARRSGSATTYRATFSGSNAAFMTASRPDRERRVHLAQRGKHRERDDLAGLRVFLRRHVLDREGEARGIRVDLDRVAVTGDRRVGPDVDHGAVGPDAGK